MRHRRNARDVDAILFDGSHESAAEISRRIGDCSYDGGRVEVATPYGRVFAGMGCWIVRDRQTRALSVVDDREFSAHFERIDDPRSIGPMPSPRGDCGCPLGAVCKTPTCARLARASRWDVV